jgi:mannonate dehydratase
MPPAADYGVKPMHVGDQDVLIVGDKGRSNLQYLVRNGVTHIDSYIGEGRDNALYASEDEYRAAIAACAAEGITLEMTHIAIPESITLGLDERDADIAQICRCIENAGRAGLRGLNYNFLVGAAYARTEEVAATVGRGGCSYSQFDFDRYDNSAPEMLDGKWSNGGAGIVSREEVYARAKYFLERVMPTAEEFNVQMACHLNDPPAPVLRGVEQWNFPVFEGIRRFSELVDSPMHGFNFCCGTAAEGLSNPGVELYEIVEHFGRRQQLFNIHCPGQPARGFIVLRSLHSKLVPYGAFY